MLPENTLSSHVLLLAQTQAKVQQSNPWTTLLLMLSLFFIFYVFMIRPQQKKQKQLQEKIAKLKKGDCIINVGGLYFTITSVRQETVIGKFFEGDTKAEISKAAITAVLVKNSES